MMFMALLLSCAFPQNNSAETVDAVWVAKAAKVYTADDAGMINNGMVIVKGQKIVWIGPASEADVGEDVPVIDLGNLWLVPGLIEPHNHVAGGLRDLNDTVFLANPELHTQEVLEPENPLLLDGIAGGVTSALFIPGSGSNMGGFGMLVKTSGKTVEEMTVRAPGSLKVAQAGNPERWGYGVGRALMNWNTRHTFEQGLGWAKDYAEGKADWDPKWADFAKLRDQSVPVSVHTQIFQVVMTTITMLKRDLGVDAFVDHGTFDGYKNGPLAVQYGVAVMNGPRQFWFDRSTSRIEGCAAGWAKNEGLVLGYNTDAPVIPQEELSFQAAMGVRLGAGNAESALKGMTAFAADALNMDNIAGILKPGLDADFVAWTGDPVDPRSHVVEVWVRGESVYQAQEGRRF